MKSINYTLTLLVQEIEDGTRNMLAGEELYLTLTRSLEEIEKLQAKVQNNNSQYRDH